MMGLFLLLLFTFSIGAVVVNEGSCTCETISFTSKEMEGHFKNPSVICPNSTCNYFIEPLDKHTIILETQDCKVHYANFIYYYRYDDKVKVGPLVQFDIQQNAPLVAPEGYGIYIEYNYFDSTNCQVNFKRVHINETTHRCPPPFFNNSAAPQVINADNFPNGGCAIRLISPDQHNSRLVQECVDRRRYPIITFNSPRDNLSDWEVQRRGNSSVYWLTLPWDVEFFVRSSYLSGCQLKYFSLDYNPCNCSNTNFILSSGQTVNFTSPGYPSMLCPFVSCQYNIQMKTPAPNNVNYKNAFLVKTVYLSQEGNDQLNFKMGKETFALEKFGPDNLNVFVGESLDVLYRAFSVFSANHGFQMRIEAIQLPLDCLCHGNGPKVLPDSGSTSMTIPPHCSYMFCRFSIPNNMERMFHLDVNYNFAQPLELLHINGGQKDYVIRQSANRKEIFNRYKEDLLVNDTMKITYMRSKNDKITNNSSFEMNWKWLTHEDCLCGETFFMATPGKWSFFYSPRYPRDYCVSMNCTYHIQAPEGHFLQFATQDFNTEPHSDFVSFYEGSNLLKKWNGNVSRSSVNTLGNKATAVFISDASETARGFKILFVAIPNPKFIPVDYGYSSLKITISLILLLMLLAAFFYKKKLCQRKKLADNFENPIYGYSVSSEDVILNFKNNE